jgi:RNA polymerase sigma factor (sigma-70 family)
MKTGVPAETDSSARSEGTAWTPLVERIRLGDQIALEELYKIFAGGVRFHLYRQLGPRDLEDRVHDIFLLVTQSIQRGDLRDPECLMGYVRTIVRRQIAVYIEEAVHIRRNQTDIEFGMYQSDQRPSAEHLMMAEQNTRVALKVLNSLPGRDREVLIRFYLKEQTQQEICGEMNLTETQFRLIKSRAKARFGELGRRSLSRKTGFRG